MRNGITFIPRLGVAFALVALSLGAAAANAQSLRVNALPPRRPSHAPAASPAPKGPEHSIFGRITSLKGTELLVRLRSGRALRVDASEAISTGRYSAPLFVGKYVVVSGELDAAGTLHAKTVTRLTRLDARTPSDR